MRALRVLLTNNALAYHAGSETYLRDVALSLLRRGHRPVAFSLIHGTVADELRILIPPIKIEKENPMERHSPSMNTFLVAFAYAV